MRTEKSAVQPVVSNTLDEREVSVDFIDSFQDFRREERVALAKFIEQYEALPCLWNKKDPAFNSKLIKEEAYKQLAALANKINANVHSIDWVKNKIAGLRTVFLRDYKRVVETLDSPHVYIPKLWYFGLMLFITESEGKNIQLNAKIRSLLNLKVGGNITIECIDLDCSGVEDTEKTEHRDAISEFIRIYKSHPCLWSLPKSMVHFDKNYKESKAKAHQDLLNSVNTHFPGADLDWVKRKISKLRAAFFREHRKVERALAEGEKYTTTLWYYNQMRFIVDVDHRRTVQNVNITSHNIVGNDHLDELCEDTDTEGPLKYNYADEGCLDDLDLAEAAIVSADPDWNLVDSASDINSTKIAMSDLLLNTDSSQGVEQMPTSSSSNIIKPVRKRKRDVEEQEPVMIHLPELSNPSYNAMDELSGFSASMAAKLRRMSQEQRDLAELEIGRILFLGLRGRLVDSTILPPVPEHNYPDCTL